MPKTVTLLLAACLMLALVPAPLSAQTTPSVAPAPKPAEPPKKKYDPYASPLEVIMSFRLWTNPPPAQDFVKATRPDPKTLDYTPLVGKDPERPKPRDAKGVADLRAELEKDLETNARKGKAVTVRASAGGSADTAKPAARKRKKAAAAAPQ